MAEHTRRKLFSYKFSYDIAVPSNIWNKLVPSPSDGWHACSRRCQLALDLTVRGTGYLYPPPALSGRLQRGWCCSFFVFDFVAFIGTIYPAFLLHFHLVVADRRATARTTELLSHAASRPKKIRIQLVWYLTALSKQETSQTPLDACQSQWNVEGGGSLWTQTACCTCSSAVQVIMHTCSEEK